MRASTISIPHNFTPRGYQLPLLRYFSKPNDVGDDGRPIGKRAVVVWHRRAGKDKTTINIVVSEAIKRRGTYFYFFPTYSQGKKILWDGMDGAGFKFIDHIPSQLIAKKNEADMKVTLINGSIIQVVGTEDINKLVGTNPVGCVFSEYSVQDPQAWDFIRPILAENGGWAIFVFTPRGMNHGWQILQTAKSEKSWFWQVLTTHDTGAISQDALDQEKRQLPLSLYEQEYECKFVEGASQFFRGVDSVLWSGDLQPRSGGVYSVGVDLAKMNDWTVLTPFEHNTFKVGRQERFNQVDYVLQEAKIESFYHKYNKGLIRLDSTGVGEPVFDHLSARGIYIDPFRFTEVSRMNLLNNLRILIEQGRILLPNDPILISELKDFQYSISEGSSKVRVAVPEHRHDDTVMSLALAVWDAREPLGDEEMDMESPEALSLYGRTRFA